jgi:hypothetical protein
MISFIHPEDQFTPPVDIQSIADQIHKQNMQFHEDTVMQALIDKFGKLPTAEEIAKHLTKVIETNGNITHYVWTEKKPEIGETIDMSQVICSIAPPQIFNPEPPEN